MADDAAVGGDTTVIIDVQVEDNSSSNVENITNHVVHLHQAAQRSEKQNDRWSDSVKRMAKVALPAARAVGRVVASMAAVAAVSGPAVTGLVATGKALAAVGRSAAGLGALVAFVPSLVGAVKLITGTLKLAGPGLATALEPVTRFFVDADGNASRFAKRLQALIGTGVRPLAQQFARADLPFIARAMERITVATNGTVRATGKWLVSAEGQRVVSTITDATAAGFERLAPKVTAAAIAMGRLSGRAGDRAVTGLADLIGRIVDKFTAWADNTSVQDINKALKDLSGWGLKLKSSFTAIRDIGRWMGENQGKVRAFSDTVAAGAVAIGIATGNIPAVLAGSFVLVLNHWDQLKGKFAGAGSWIGELADKWQHDAGRIKVAESLMNALRGFRDSFLSMTKDIAPKWEEFMGKLKHAWDQWAPIIAAWWNTGGKATFMALGAALGAFVLLMLDAATKTAQFTAFIAEAFKGMVRVVLDVLGWIVHGAATAFSWVPGLGPKLGYAADAFDAFAMRVNKALAGIDPIKTVRINASVYVTGGGNVSGGVDQRTGNSRNAGLSGLTSWQRVAAAFAGSRETSRTGGPAPVTATVQNTIMLDGRPFRAYTDRVLMESERRTAWRARVGVR